MTPLGSELGRLQCHLEEQPQRQGNVLRGHRESIGVVRREALKPLQPFDACDKQGTRVNSLSLVRYVTIPPVA